MSTMPIFENPCGAYSRYEVTKSIPLDRLEAICTAEMDGRLVVLPCKVGDTVYLLDDGYGNPVEAETDYWMTGENGLIGSVVFGTGQRMKFIDRRIGKTVFLTREEAEAALKEVK
jgi:hypothetical protein